jgi:hypothetical protein
VVIGRWLTACFAASIRISALAIFEVIPNFGSNRGIPGTFSAKRIAVIVPLNGR